MIFPQTAQNFYRYPQAAIEKNSFPGGIKAFQILLAQALRISVTAFSATYSPSKPTQTLDTTQQKTNIYQIQYSQLPPSSEISSPIKKPTSLKDEEKTQIQYQPLCKKSKDDFQTEEIIQGIVNLENFNEKNTENVQINGETCSIYEEFQEKAQISYAKLPQFGLSGSQIMKKREQLLKRQVQNWKVKAKKQRVELRRIKD